MSLRNEQLAHELAILKRHKFDRSSEQAGSTQLRLLDESVNEDICAIELELEQNTRDLGQQRKTKQIAKRQALPAHLPARSFDTILSRPNAAVGAKWFTWATISARS